MIDTKEILSLYKRDERAAIQLLFDIYYESLLLYCYRMIHDTQGAEDIVQDCFVYLWTSRRLENFDGALDRFLYQSVRYRALNYRRDQYRRGQLHEASYEETLESPVVGKAEEEMQEIDLLHRTVNRLPDECRKIFLMASLDDMKYQEIADALQVSINTVKTQMKIALRFLREHLTKDSFSSLLYMLILRR